MQMGRDDYGRHLWLKDLEKPVVGFTWGINF